MSFRGIISSGMKTTHLILRHIFVETLHWRHNDHDGVSNHQPHDCLLNRLFRRRSKKTSKLRVSGLCVGNSPGTGEFPAQMARNAENVSIWWRHLEIGFHGLIIHEFTSSRKLVWSSPTVLKHRQYHDYQESTKNVNIKATKQSITKTWAFLSNTIQLYSVAIASWIKTCCTCASIHIALYCMVTPWPELFSALLALCRGNLPLIPLTNGQRCATLVFLCCKPVPAVEQRIDLPLISDATTLMWHHWNGSSDCVLPLALDI